jgi:hypothetical protein
MTDRPGSLDPRFRAALDLIGRTGADEFQVRISEEELPAVWIALARHGDHWSVGAAISGPTRAVFSLCDSLIDGAVCTHCLRPTACDPDPRTTDLMHATEEVVCWYRYDPELATFRRGCEGRS